jgi:hypothetical protein
MILPLSITVDENHGKALTKVVIYIYVNFRTKCLLLCCDFNQPWIFSTNFCRTAQYVYIIPQKSARRSRVLPCERIDVHAVTTKLIVTYCKLVNTPKSRIYRDI